MVDATQKELKPLKKMDQQAVEEAFIASNLPPYFVKVDASGVDFTKVSSLNRTPQTDEDKTKYRAREFSIYSSNLNGSNFSGLNLRGLEVDRGGLEVGDKPSSFENVNFNNANLRNVLLKVSLSGSSFSGAVLNGAILGNGSDLQGFQAPNADLTKAAFNTEDLSDSNFSNANLTNVNFDSKNLQRANFSGANLTGAQLTYVNLQGADLRGANLAEAEFSTIGKDAQRVLSASTLQKHVENLKGVKIDLAAIHSITNLDAANKSQMSQYFNPTPEELAQTQQDFLKTYDAANPGELQKLGIIKDGDKYIVPQQSQKKAHIDLPVGDQRFDVVVADRAVAVAPKDVQVAGLELKSSGVKLG